MKLLISADMEGIAGITNGKQCNRDSSEFARSCVLMSDEVRAVCEGALNSGADLVVVNDSHGDQRNILHERLPAKVQLIQGRVKQLGMVQDVSAGYDAVAFIGYHAPAGSRDGILDHTYSAPGIAHKVVLNGELCSEARLNAAVAGRYGVPLILLSGDQTACADVRRFMPWVNTVEVKQAFGRTVARSLSPAEAHAALTEGIQDAIESAREGRARPYKVDGPLVLDLTLTNSEQADAASFLPHSERVDANTVRYVADDPLTMHQALRTLFALAVTI